MAKKKPARTARTGQKKTVLGPVAATLSEDHRRVEALFGQYVASDDERVDERAKDELIRQICAELILHTALEEEIFYPACRAALPQDQIIDLAQVEHDSAKVLIGDLLDAGRDDPWRDAKVEVLAAQIRHHVAEEEKPKDGIFARAAAHGVDDDALAARLKERKEALQGRAAELRPTRAISLQPTNGTEDDMARYPGYERDRDERGRFVSDDDDDRRGYRGSSSRSRGRYDEDDDDRGGRGRGRGGWFGDSEGHSHAARERFEDDDRRGYGSRYDDDDDRGGRGHGRGGWFGDSEGHSRAARERFEDDDRRGYRGYGNRSRSRYDDEDDRRGRGHGGWFGDSEGHAEASRRGWRSPDHGDSGWYGDREGHSEASRRGWDNPRHGPSGWYGDSEGHSEASRRGWDNPRHGPSGWYGDSEGHSEAGRRRWRGRD